jgi:hypothetical protein
MVDPFILLVPTLDTPTSFCKKLFPMIDEWHDRRAAKKLSPDNNDPIQPNIAANAFVQVIMVLRKTFIQDSVLMMELPPANSFDNIQFSLIQPTCHSKGNSTS